MSVINTPLRVGARALSKALMTYPIPHLSISDLTVRWHCSRSTVERFREKFSLKTAGHQDAHPEFNLCELLIVEGVEDPVAKWACGTDVDREIYLAPMLTTEDLGKLDPKLGARHCETFRRRARMIAHAQLEGPHSTSRDRKAIKLGHRWLFRPLEGDLLYIETVKDERRGQI